MRLKDLPNISVPLEPKLPDEYDYTEEDVDGLSEIIGDIFEENLFDANVFVDLDVVVYRECSQDRPWVGQVLNIWIGKNVCNKLVDMQIYLGLGVLGESYVDQVLYRKQIMIRDWRIH